MLAGVTILDPLTTHIDANVKIGQDTVIHPFSILSGVTDIGEDCEIGPGARISDSRIGSGVSVRDSYVVASEVGDGTRIGPFANLRPGSVVGQERQDRRLRGTEKGHARRRRLRRATWPIWATPRSARAPTSARAPSPATTTRSARPTKNRTTIGADAFIGTHSTLVAPVTVGDGAYTAAGSVITEDVPPDALGLRARAPGQQRRLGQRRKSAARRIVSTARQVVSLKTGRRSRWAADSEHLAHLQRQRQPGAGRARSPTTWACRSGRLHCTRFADGEIRVKIEESARGMDVFIVQPTCAPVNDSLMELLILVDAFRRASAKRITLVMPYYGYSRQDKKIKPREPVTARLVADLITTAGAHRVLAVDLHAGQIQGFFQLPLDHLYAGPLLGAHFAERGLTDGDTVVVSPDVGGVGRARGMAEMLHAPIAIIAKRRPEPNKVEIMEIIGDVRGKTCVMVDDMIDTGGSIVSGACALMERGARRVFACCTHPVLSGSAVDRIEESPITEAGRHRHDPAADDASSPRSSKITVISVAPLLANAITRIHKDDSVSELFDTYW